MYEMHACAYMWDCLRCTPIYKITLDVRVCEGCTPMRCTPINLLCIGLAKPRGPEVAAEVASPIQSLGIAMLRTNSGYGRGATPSSRTRKVTATMTAAAETARRAGGWSFGLGEDRGGGSKCPTFAVAGSGFT